MIKYVLIDDDQISNLLHQEVLRQVDPGAEVKVFSSSLHGLDMLKEVITSGENIPQYLFLDIRMPEMDGITATQHIRAMNLQKQPFILALTANAFTSDKERCLQAGMNDFLSKPFAFEQIKDKTLHYLAV